MNPKDNNNNDSIMEGSGSGSGSGIEGLELAKGEEEEESSCSSSSSEDSSDSDSDSDDYSLSTSATSTNGTSTFKKKNKKITSKDYDSTIGTVGTATTRAATVAEEEDEDLLEIEETVLRAFKEDFTLENTYLELNSLRMSFNVSVEQVWKILVKLIVLHCPPNNKMMKWVELVKKFYKDYSQERELLRCIMMTMMNHNRLSNGDGNDGRQLLLKVLALFYNEDLIGDLEEMRLVLKEYDNDATLQAFIVQVEKNEESEEEGSEEGSEEEEEE
jgi:hypothetical protein